MADQAIDTNNETEEEFNERIQRDAQKASEYLEGTPWLNIGALVMPPIWGPAKGIWVTILWYPLWVFADNCLYAWWSQGTPMATVFGILALVILAVVTIAFARLSRPIAAIRAVQKGKTKEEFHRTERNWAIASIIIGIAFLAFATYFNLYVRTPLVV